MRSASSANSGRTARTRSPLAPGVICLYDRNVETIESLAAKGFTISTADDILAAGEPIDLDGGRHCILIPSHELSRARGGPHCMTHPLERDDA